MFENNMVLCRFYLRRDWLRTIIWFTLILALAVGFGSGVGEMYPDRASLDAMIEPLDNPAFKAMIGQYYLADGELTLGGMYSVYMLVWLVMIVGCMSVALVVRHTRADEERGRLEVVRSLPVGRMANISATLSAALILNILLALLIGFGLGAVGDADRGMDYAGAFVTGAACAAFGIVMAGITAIFCQLNKNPSTAMALSYGFLGVLYVIFMMGSMQDSEAVAIASVLGLLQRSKVYVENDPFPIIITAILGIILSVVALWLCKMRDLGESLIPSRPGRAEASPYLKSPGSLAWRLLRPWVIFWGLTIPTLGLAYGSIMGDLEAFIDTNEVFRQISQGNVMVMAAMFMLVMAVIGTIPVLHFMLRARGEEKRGFAENILARSAAHKEQLFGYFIIAFVAAIFVPFLNAVGFWAGSVPVMDEPIPFGNWLLSCIVYLPAFLVLLGVAVALIGWLPKYTGLAWGYLAYSFITLYLGALLDFPEWMSKLTPFGHIPNLPYVEQLGEAPYILPDGTPLLDANGAQVIMPVFADEATYSLTGSDITAMIIMTVLAVSMIVFGFVGYRKRDMKYS